MAYRSPRPDGVAPCEQPLGLDSRLPRAERSSTIHGDDEDKATAELANIMTIASNPVSPGPSSPPLIQTRSEDFVPPTRPKSTPFPKPEQRTDNLICPRCPTDGSGAEQSFVSDADFSTLVSTQDPEKNLNDLPAEIHECILDHLFGYRVSAASKSSLGMHRVTAAWGTALRHSRRRELSELALVSNVWRMLIQDRLYRHIKLKATRRSIEDALMYFQTHSHLRSHVRHIDIWFPVFQPKYGSSPSSLRPTFPLLGFDGANNDYYVIPADNCSLEEVFYFISTTFPEVCILTLEGGERKKAPQVDHFLNYVGDRKKSMAKITSIQTLVCKGQWNLIRNDSDFEVIAAALPNLKEWHGSYSKAKAKVYCTMAAILPKLSQNLTSLNLILDSDYRREITCPQWFVEVSKKVHFCRVLAGAVPTLEHFSYTGRVCKSFFDAVSSLADSRSTRLKTIDLTVKNCCRHQNAHWDQTGSGITDLNFINAFEALVLAGLRSMRKLSAVEYLRIRYVDLDSPVPPLNPYFTLRDGWCSGVWSDAIVSELKRVRPSAQFEELSENFGQMAYNKDGRLVLSPDFPRKRVLSLKLSNYALLNGGIVFP